MKKKILSDLAKYAEELDNLKLYKEANVINTLFFRIAQLNDWDLPPGAANDPTAPWNQNDGYQESADRVDKKISDGFIPIFKAYYEHLLKLLKHALIHAGGNRQRAIENLFNVDPYYKESENAYNNFHTQLEKLFGNKGQIIAEESAGNFIQFAAHENNEHEIIQWAEKTIQPHLDDLYEADSLSDY